jgi:hypothetical protein
MLLKGNEIVARSSAGVIWNAISFERMGNPTGGACVPQKQYRVASDEQRPLPRKNSDEWRVTSDEQSPSPLEGQGVAPSPRLGRGGRNLVAQGPQSGPPILMAGGFSSGAGSCRAANKVISIPLGRVRDSALETSGLRRLRPRHFSLRAGGCRPIRHCSLTILPAGGQYIIPLRSMTSLCFQAPFSYNENAGKVVQAHPRLCLHLRGFEARL